MDGKYDGEWIITQNSFDNFFLKSSSKLDNIDINNLFQSFNNFGQTTITSENITGNLTGNVDLTTEIENNLKLIEDKLKCSADIEIINGKLKNYEPIYKLSNFIDLEELEEIDFSKLSNQIVIKDRIISIPEMEVHSSAYNLSVEGKHTFDNIIDYKIQILFSELLSKKVRERNYKKNNELFSKKGRLKIPIVIYGSIDSLDYKINFKKAASNIKSGLQKEKYEVQTIIKQEFSSSDKNIKEKSDSIKSLNNFDIDWEESSDDTKENKNEKFDIIWEEFDDTL